MNQEAYDKVYNLAINVAELLDTPMLLEEIQKAGKEYIETHKSENKILLAILTQSLLNRLK
jgi:hypothetical protein